MSWIYILLVLYIHSDRLSKYPLLTLWCLFLSSIRMHQEIFGRCIGEIKIHHVKHRCISWRRRLYEMPKHLGFRIKVSDSGIVFIEIAPVFQVSVFITIGLKIVFFFCVSSWLKGSISKMGATAW